MGWCFFFRIASDGCKRSTKNTTIDDCDDGVDTDDKEVLVNIDKNVDDIKDGDDDDDADDHGVRGEEEDVTIVKTPINKG